MHRVLKLFSFRAFLLSVVIIYSGYCSAKGFLTTFGLIIMNAAIAYGDDRSSPTPALTGSRLIVQATSSSDISPSRSTSSAFNSADSSNSTGSTFNSDYSSNSTGSAFNSSYSSNTTGSAYPVYSSHNLVPLTGASTQASNSGADSLFLDPKMVAVAIGAGFIFADQAIDGVKVIVGASINGAKGLYATVVGSANAEDIDDD